MHAAASTGNATESPAAPKLTLAPIVFERKAAQGDVFVTQRSVKFSGAGHATLAMRWSLSGF
jgi:hypothetical protein